MSKSWLLGREDRTMGGAQKLEYVMCNFLVSKLQLGNTLAWKLQLPVSKRVEAGASTIKGVPKLELGNEKRRD